MKRLGSNDLAMDLGTANTLVYMRGMGIILNQPSVVAIDEELNKAVAVGHEAKEMYGKTSRSIRCFRPMKDGVIADFEMTTVMIKSMLRKVTGSVKLFRPRIVIGVPSGITQVEKKAVIDAALCSGVRNVSLVEEPMAAALGADLPVDKAVGNMIVDIGGGTTEVAILSMNETLYSHSIRVAGDIMDEAIQRHVQRVYGLQIGIMEAERIKLLIGSALPFGKSRSIPVCGRDMATGRPAKIDIPDARIREALHEPINAIIASITTALEQTSPEIARDIVSRGVHLAGGGSLLKGLSERLYRETSIRFHVSADPLSAVVRGVGKIIDNYKSMKVLCIA
jgi:rod shape-determining protein MreB